MSVVLLNVLVRVSGILEDTLEYVVKELTESRIICNAKKIDKLLRFSLRSRDWTYLREDSTARDEVASLVAMVQELCSRRNHLSIRF